jgi:biotin--protein ligase
VNLDREEHASDPSIIETLVEHDTARMNFLKACLAKLGLQVSTESSTVPSLSPLHVSALDSRDAASLIATLQDILIVEDGQEYIKDDNDKFRVEKPSSLGMSGLAAALPDSSAKTTDDQTASEDRIIDYNEIVKTLVLHEDTPGSKLTPYFNHNSFYGNLKEYRSESKEQELYNFGSHIMYAEVITSTNTILEK